MTDREQLLESITTKITDYREGEIPRPTPEHVDRWLSQFAPEVQFPLLSELSHVLERTYISKSNVETFLSKLVINPKLAGTDFCSFWRNAEFLNIQQGGNSQTEMLEMFSQALQRQCGFSTQSGLQNPHAYIYLDDGLFSGNRIKQDLQGWIRNEAPSDATLHIIVIVNHSGGSYFTKKNIKSVIAEFGKNIDLNIWRAFVVENTRYRKNISEVLWPHILPESQLLMDYVNSIDKFPFEPRAVLNSTTYQHRVFSSESGRQLLESELLLAGVKIRSFCENPKPIMRPLGYSFFGLGFGSTFVTFRNCPNNAPLAFWWGDPDMPSGHPFSKWYPLFPRKTHGQNVDFRGIDLSDFEF